MKNSSKLNCKSDPKKDVTFCEVLFSQKGKDFFGEWPTLIEAFSITANKYPDNECYREFQPKTLVLTYREALAMVERLAGYLYDIGVRKGDIVALSGKNSVSWAISYFAISFAGATIAPLDNALTTKELINLMTFSGVKVGFFDDNKIDNLIKEGYKFNSVISLTENDKYDYIFDIAKKSDKRFRACNVTEEDTAAILFTSGTTGSPKGVMLSHRNFTSDGVLTLQNVYIESKDVFYAILPVHHAYCMAACLIIPMIVGASVVFGKSLVPKVMFKELKEGKVTILLAVPMLYNKIIENILKGIKEKGFQTYTVIDGLMTITGGIKQHTGKNPGKRLFNFILKKISFENIRICISGGGPLPESTFRYFNAIGANFVQGYGLTETSPVLSLNPVHSYKTASIGKILPLVEAKIVDPDEFGNGLIYVKGPMLMKGYFKNEEATREVIDKDGWFNTGDIGHIDKDNYLFLSGRAKNIIVTEGGKNVYPEEIEDEFQTYSQISQVMVAGFVQDKSSKVEKIMIIIKPSDLFIEEKKGDKAEVEKEIDIIVQEVNRNLQSYKKIEKTVFVYEEMPMTSTKKIKRKEVLSQLKLD